MHRKTVSGWGNLQPKIRLKKKKTLPIRIIDIDFSSILDMKGYFELGKTKFRIFENQVFYVRGKAEICLGVIQGRAQDNRILLFDNASSYANIKLKLVRRFKEAT